MPRFRVAPPLTVLAALCLGGCGLFTDDDPTIRAEGTVVSAESGDPIAGLTVALDEIVGISHVYVETVRTDGEGRFRLAYEATESFGYRINVNESPYDPAYSRFREVFQPGERRNLGVIELEARGE